MQDSSNRYYKEDNQYNKQVTNKLRENLKHNIKVICNEYRFDHTVMRSLVEWPFNLDLYYKFRVNRMMYDPDYYRDQKYFIEK